MATSILIAGHNQVTCASLARACDRIGCEAVHAETPLKAKIALDTRRYALFVCDLDWPGAPSRGLELLAHARQVDRGIATILLAAKDAELSPTQVPFAGLYACLPKPLPRSEIVAITLAGAMRCRSIPLQPLRGLGLSLQHPEDPGAIMAATAQALLDSLDIDAVALRLAKPAGGGCTPLIVTNARRPLSTTDQQALHDLLERDTLPEPPEGIEVPVKVSAWRRSAAAALNIAGGSRLAGVIASNSERMEEHDAQALLETCLALAGAALSCVARLDHAHDLASRDGLTGLYSHGRFMALVRSEIDRARSDCDAFAVIMLDVDSRHGLKEVNDQYGHQAGDRLVVHLARLLSAHARPGDMVARYGGDEFLILAPKTDEQQAQALAQGLIDTLHASELPISESVQVHVTLSAGVAVFHPDQREGADSLLSRADRALYAAKKEGTSRVHVDRAA